MTNDQAQRKSIAVDWPLDNTRMYATVERPEGEGPFPAVVMVAGSGPTDRDWNSPLIPGTNGSARLLAEALAEQGFASIRYDKRAAGLHAAENFPRLIGKVSFQTHLDELAGAVAFLAEQDFVDQARVFGLANSEGTLHVLNYQVQRRLDNGKVAFAGLVLIAPPGRVMGEVGRAQIAAQLAGVPGGQDMLAAYDAAIMRFQAEEEATPDANLPQGVLMLLQGPTNPANLPFARELWSADAAAWLREVTVPTLVIIGQKDIQVDWKADGGRLQEAVGLKASVDFLFPENANHVLKHEPRPRNELNPAELAASYNAPESVLDPQALAAVIGWLKTQAQSGRTGTGGGREEFPS